MCAEKISIKLLSLFIFILASLASNATYAIEDLEIQNAFENIIKRIKGDRKSGDIDVLERKSEKFDITISQNSWRNFDINSVLKEAKHSLELGNNETAISLLLQVTAKFPYHEGALIGLGNIYYSNKELEKAVEIYTKLLKEYSNNEYILKNFLTIISQYKPDLALNEMSKLYDICKNYAPLLANIGLIYTKKENYLKAKEFMLAAVSLDQNNIFYIYNLAIILDNLSDFKNARVFYTKFLSMSKNEVESLLHKKVAERLKFIQLHDICLSPS